MLYIKWINDSSEQFFPYQIIYYEWRNWTFVGLWKIWIKYLLLWGYTAPKTQMSVIISFTGENLDVTAEQMILLCKQPDDKLTSCWDQKGVFQGFWKKFLERKLWVEFLHIFENFGTWFFFFQFQEQVHSLNWVFFLFLQ